MSRNFEQAFAVAKKRFENWPTIADVPADRNPLVALADAVALLDEPSDEADRYIQGMTNSSTVPTWRGGGKNLPRLKYRHFTSDIQAALWLYTLIPGGKPPEMIPSTALGITKDALRKFVDHVMEGGE